MTDAFRMLLVWFGTVSALTLFLFGWDKLMAKLGRRRLPEAALLGAARCGGGAGGAQFSRNLLAMLAGRNLTLTRKIGHMARRSIRDKLHSYLSAQALQAGRSEFDIPLDRQQLADYLAVDRSSMSTTLGRLRDEGVLTFRKNHFHLLREMDEAD